MLWPSALEPDNRQDLVALGGAFLSEQGTHCGKDSLASSLLRLGEQLLLFGVDAEPLDAIGDDFRPLAGSEHPALGE